MISTTHLTALQVLYSMAAADEPANLHALALRLGCDCRHADSILGELEKLGLVDAERVRLSLAGLAVAVSARGRRLRGFGSHPRAPTGRCRLRAA